MDIDFSTFTAELVIKDFEGAKKKKENQTEENSNRLIVFLQILIIFYFKVYPFSPFNPQCNLIVIGILGLGIVFILLKIIKILQAENAVIEYKDILLKEIKKVN